MIEFIDRLKHIQSERLYHPWMTRLGVGKGSAQSMAGVKDDTGNIKHGLPSMSTLLQICRIENASYRYLVEGIGEPFQVTRLSSDRALAEHLEAVWAEGGWNAVLIEQDDALRAVVLANACQIEVGADERRSRVDYTCIDVVTGPVGARALAWCNAARAAAGYDGRVLRKAVDADTLNALLGGKLGTWRLFEAPDALLTLPYQDQLSKVSDVRGEYAVMPEIENQDTLAIARAIDALDEPQRQHVKALLGLFSGD